MRLLLFLLLTTLTARAQQSAGHYVALRGIRFYYEAYGRPGAPPLLLLHGNGGSTAAFARNIPYFARHYRVVALDSRAQGRSVDPADSLSFEQMADDAAALLRQLRLDSANVVGWSDGGIVALLLAQRHPRLVRRLAASGANLWPGPDALTPPEWAQLRRGYRQGRDSTFRNPRRRNTWKVFRLDVEQPHIRLAALRRIAAPALIIAGSHDIIQSAHTRAIARALPRGRLWIVPRSGHATLREHAAAFNRRVDAFFGARR